MRNVGVVSGTLNRIDLRPICNVFALITDGQWHDESIPTEKCKFTHFRTYPRGPMFFLASTSSLVSSVKRTAEESIWIINWLV